MKKTIIKCYYNDGIVEKKQYPTAYDKKHDRNAEIFKYRRYILKDCPGYILNENLAMYKIDGKGTPCIIDIRTGVSIGSADLKVWGVHPKTFKEVESQDIEALDNWLNENVRNKDYYIDLAEKVENLKSGAIKEILERIRE